MNLAGPNPQSPDAGRAPARDPKKAGARIPIGGERSNDGTLDRVGVAPVGVNAVRPQAGMAFARKDDTLNIVECVSTF
jgi:hypothetical protein